MIVAAAHTSGNAPSAFLAYVVYPTLVGLILAAFTFGAWIVRTLSTQDRALGVLVNEVSPEKGESLRTIVNRHTELIAEAKATADANAKSLDRVADMLK